MQLTTVSIRTIKAEIEFDSPINLVLARSVPAVLVGTNLTIIITTKTDLNTTIGKTPSVVSTVISLDTLPDNVVDYEFNLTNDQ